jgi:hypothetical protein
LSCLGKVSEETEIVIRRFVCGHELSPNIFVKVLYKTKLLLSIDPEGFGSQALIVSFFIPQNPLCLAGFRDQASAGYS